MTNLKECGTQQVSSAAASERVTGAFADRRAAHQRSQPPFDAGGRMCNFDTLSAPTVCLFYMLSRLRLGNLQINGEP